VSDDDRPLVRSLARARDALAKGNRMPEALRHAEPSPGPAATALAVAAIVLFAVAFKTGHHWILVLAMAVAAAGGLLVLSPQARGLLGALAGHGPADRAQVGMGATVASDAVLEPGARVEMGASVGRGAVVRSGAVVRMGASVGKGAIVESGATVSWGASVHADAVVEQGAIVGAGSDVLRGARVPAGMWLRPGSTFGGNSSQHALQRTPAPPPSHDPREARLASICNKLGDELRAAPERVREFLGDPHATIAALRATCEDLARRERELRAEADPAALARLDEERAALEKRVASQPDPQVAASLRGALAAIDEQRRQREIVRVAADRLDAEHTRLLYTMEGLASQFVRLRGAGAAGREPADLGRAVEQLRSELDAIASAVEEVAATSPMARFAEAPPDASPSAGGPSRVKD
jgi:carbonic anhydrase/acetyltransferase-like protein (isoleucine patch superfamily)